MFPRGPWARVVFGRSVLIARLVAPRVPRICYPLSMMTTPRSAMNKRVPLLLAALAAVSLLSACAGVGQAAHPSDPNDPANAQQYVSLVNSLNWTNALSGKRDGSRSSWPLRQAAGQEEVFPLAQLKQCKGEACAWGVMRARRSFGAVTYVPGGMNVEVTLHIDVDRRQEMHKAEFNTAMAIPADVPGLRSTKDVHRTLTLQYGKIQHIDFDYGVGFDLCALRYDAAGHALDACDIPYI